MIENPPIFSIHFPSEEVLHTHTTQMACCIISKFKMLNINDGCDIIHFFKMPISAQSSAQVVVVKKQV